MANPLKRKSYGENASGRSPGVNADSGRPSPAGDNGTITCHAALASFPYTPEESMKASHDHLDLLVPARRVSVRRRHVFAAIHYDT